LTHRSERLLNQLMTAPRAPEVDERKARFAALNEFISQRGGWCTSVPGAFEITFDALPGSPVPDDLRARGYIVEKTGDSQRTILHTMEIAAVEQYDLRMS
jgi:hypothetical protein